MQGYDTDRRIARLEEGERDLQKILQQLIISTTRTNDLVQRHQELLPIIQQMQIEMSNAQLVQKAFLWLAGTVGGSVVALILGLIFTRAP